MATWYDSPSKQIATERAKRLQSRLIDRLGGKWKVEVSRDSLYKGKREGGYHYKVWLGAMSVSQYGDKRFTCLLSDEAGNHGGLGIWTVPNDGQTPEGSVIKQLLATHTLLQGYSKAVYSDTWSKMTKDKKRPEEAQL